MTQKFLDTTTHTVSWFYKRHSGNELKLRPPFQRRPVWLDGQKAYLIDTILKGYPVPEVYTQEFTDHDGLETVVVVDGQQRLTACIEYIDNKFPLGGPDVTELEGLYFRDLTEDQRKIIYNYTFVARKLPEMEEDTLRAIFRRINRNTVSLNAQELRHSTYWGPFIKLMEEIADDDRWAEFAIFTPNDVRRMLDVEFVSELAVATLHGPQNKKASIEKWYETYEGGFDDVAQLRKVFHSVLGEVQSLLPNIAKTRWRKKSDFYTLFLMLAEISDRLPLSREERSDLSDRLLIFGSAVDSYIRGLLKNPPAEVVAYSDAVERAASDLATRKARMAQLKKVTGLENVPKNGPSDSGLGSDEPIIGRATTD